MELIRGIEAIDLSIYLKEHSVLVLSDFHLGFEESLNMQGVLVPRFQLNDVLQRLECIFKKVHPRTVVLNGDFKHEFGAISKQEWGDALKVLDFVKKHCSEVVIIKGNHDNILAPIAEKRNIKIVKEFRIGKVLIMHGNELPQKSAETIIIGHVHPAISLRENGRVEKFKCFLAGRFNGNSLIVQPSFNLVIEGSDVLKESVFSPFLKGVKDFCVFIVDDKKNAVLKFGKMRHLL